MGSQLQGCGKDEDGETLHGCKVVLQTMCEDLDERAIWNGYETSEQEYSEASASENLQQKNERSGASANPNFGRHENMEFYERCKSDASRHGFECASERNIHPYTSISPWND